jgi:hypothetical protein
MAMYSRAQFFAWMVMLHELHKTEDGMRANIQRNKIIKNYKKI